MGSGPSECTGTDVGVWGSLSLIIGEFMWECEGAYVGV